MTIAHLLADFFLQPYEWVKRKKDYGPGSRYLYYHVIIVGVVTYLLMWDWSEWLVPLFIAASHFLIDWWKSRQKDTAGTFLADQAAHILMLLIGWAIYVEMPAEGPGKMIQAALNDQSLWVVTACYLLTLRPMGFFIEKVTMRWRLELLNDNNEKAGLTDAGTWIGYIERVIIITFILLNEFSAIGFLIAAKSIFRFSGGVKDHNERKQAEYILIGTLISFALAILLGIVALALI